MYARYSTDEQNPRSIDDQFLRCRQFLKERGFTDVEIIEESDAGISGRRRNRPGIDRVVELIENGGCDIVVAEELSRLYRKTAFAFDLFARAVDASVRVLTVTDGIDTEDEKWRVLAPVQSIVSEMFLQQTSARIRRSADGRWAAGFAVKPILPGYLRIAMNPNADDKRRRGPYRDEKDKRWTPVIREAFERAAQGEPSWQTARFLNQRGLPLPIYCTLKQWSAETAWRWLGQPLYAGFEVFRRTISRPSELSGESRKVPASADQMLTREMTHLAHIPRWLWERVQEVRRAKSELYKRPRGKDNHLTGIPRDRRGPLSTLFYCGVCGARMHALGHAYRCSSAMRCPRLAQGEWRRCWNRCTPNLATIHDKIGVAIVEALFAHAEQFGRFCEMISARLRQGEGQVTKVRDRLRRDLANLDQRITRLVKAVESSGDLGKLTETLREREAERRRLELELERLEECDVTQIPVPTQEDIRRLLEEIKPRLLEHLDAEAGAILRQLIPRIEAHPYKIFDNSEVVLRAHFTLDLLRLLPQELQQFLQDEPCLMKKKPAGLLSSITIVVDLFERCPALKLALVSVELFDSGLKRREIEKKLGVSQYLVERALARGRAMRSQGLTDPYIRLHDKPTFTKRWTPDEPENGDGSTAKPAEATRAGRKKSNGRSRRSRRQASKKTRPKRRQR